MHKKIQVIAVVLAIVLVATLSMAAASSELKSSDIHKEKSKSVLSQKPQTLKDTLGKKSEKPIKLGEPLDNKVKITLDELMKNPKNYLDKKVTIQGKVIQGCHHAGKWIRIQSGKNDIDVYAPKSWHFPLDHKGMLFTVTGVVKKQLYKGEKLEKHIEHQNTEHGGNMKIEDYPDGLVVYYIDALGAVGTKSQRQSQNRGLSKK